MKKTILLNNTLRFIVALFLVGMLFLLNSTQNEKVAALADASDDAVTSLAKERNISIEEARIRVRWQQKAGALDDKLKAILPKADYGSLWINNSNDRVNIGLVNNESGTLASSKQKIINEAKSAGISDGVDFVTVKYPFSTLEHTTDTIFRLYKENVGPKDWPIQMGIKTDLNKVQVDIPADSKNLTAGHRFVISEIEKRFKDQVFSYNYDEVPQLLAECNWWYCNSPLRGGVGLRGSNGGYDTLDCTAGFIVQGNSSGNLYILTAGHCDPHGQDWGTQTYNYTSKQIGPITNSLYDDASPYDAMIIRIEEDTYNWDVIGKILKRDGDSNMGLNGYGPPSYDEEYNIANYTSNVVGERVCTSPAVTGGWASEPNGGSCGAIQELNVYLTPGPDYITTRVHRAGLCVRPGDSGAPVFASSNAARGIIRAGSGAVCSNNKYYTPMGLIMDRFSDIGSGISIY
jgi:hypothetical protein